MNSPLAVIALVGRMVVLFSALMGVPLAFAIGQHDAALRAFITAIAVTLCAGLLMSLATRRFMRAPCRCGWQCLGSVPLTPTSRPCRASPPPGLRCSAASMRCR